MEKTLAVPRRVATVQGENAVRIMRTHPKYLFMPAMLTVLAIVAVVFTAIYIPESYKEVPARAVVFGVIALIWVLGSFKRVFTWISNRYVITTRQVVKLSGIIWVNSHATKIERISDVRSSQGWLDRIFGCGTLHLINASAGGLDAEPQVTLYDVPRVQDVHQQIEELLEALRRPDPLFNQWNIPGMQVPIQAESLPAEQDQKHSVRRWGVGGHE
ncbi:PH domain-containing protein [Glutamicibacter arilaitensis]